MKITVLADKDGAILGAIKETKAEIGAPAAVGFRPAEGQQVHEIDLPDELVTTEALPSLPTRFKLETLQTAKLVLKK